MRHIFFIVVLLAFSLKAYSGTYFSDKFTLDYTTLGQEATITRINIRVDRNGFTYHNVDVTIPEYIGTYRVTDIAQNAVLSEKGEIRSVSISDGVKTIGDAAFKNCDNLKYVTMNYHDCELTSIGNDAFSGCHNLASITLPKRLTSIGDGCFGDCDKLTSIDIPYKVTSIGEGAFWGSGIKSFSLQKGVTYIKMNTFRACDSLKVFYCHSETPPSVYQGTWNDAFGYYNDRCKITLCVPTGSVGAYASRKTWCDFQIMELPVDKITDTLEIRSAEELVQFATRVNNGETSLNARLQADIDFRAHSDIAIDNRYYGEFDGAGHSIKLNLKRGGLFSYLSGYVHDLITEGQIDTSEKYAAGIASQTENALVERCQSHVTISSRVHGDGTHGGIVGVSHTGTIIRDCLVGGSITGNQTNCCAGVSGWADGTTTIRDCLVTTNFTVSKEGSDWLARNESNVISRNNFFWERTWDATNNCNVTALTEQQVKSGEACYKLNRGRKNTLTTSYSYLMIWYQTLGEDTYPVPDNHHLPVLFVNGSYINEEVIKQKYRYYNLVITGLQGGGDCIQFSEFDLLDESLNEVAAMNVYAGTEGFDNESWPNVTDNDVHTKYCGSFSGNTYFLFDAMSEIEPYGYRFYTASDTPSFPERNPSSWKLYGSNTKLTDPNDPGWEFIDGRNNDMILQATSYVPYDFYVQDVTNKLSLSKQSITLLPNDELQLQVRDRFNAIQDLTLQWTSSNTSVATVNNQGLVVAKGLGSANITVTAVEDNTLKATCTVSVVADLPMHRYYQFAVEATAGNTQIQLSEFDLLDQNGIEITPLSTYAYTGSAYSDNETQEKLFDDDINTKYCGPFSSGPTLYIYIDAGKMVSLSGYRMTTAYDTRDYPERNPVTWSLLGSNTKSNQPNDAVWTLLDHRENDNTLGAQNMAAYDFFFTYPQEDIIAFADANVKAVCVANWDTNGDGELSEAEAAAVTDLGELFRGNTSITSFNELQYFTGLTSIGDYAFRDCIALTSIILPESVTTIKGGALRNTAITTLTIPASVTSIEVNSDSGGVTEDCSSLMNIHVEEGNSRYYSVDGVVFTEDEELVGINGKAIVMFPQGRSGSYEIPSGVTIVGPRAFVSCKSLTSVSIPNFMTNIGNCSFFSCYSLADVWCYAETIPTISSWAFEGSPIDFATLHVPASSLQVYKATTPWKDFGTIIAIDEEVSTETVKIASAADLANFANRVNAGENKLNAVLTADIDFTTYPDVMIENRYYGEFDGRGHSIKLKLKCKGLFCYLSGYVHDLITLGSITTSEQFAGGIASQTEKCTIERCQIKMSISSTVNGDGTHGGIVGVSHEGTLIRDCIFCGSIRGNQTSCCGGLSGWADGTTAISNCLIKSTFSVGATNSDKLARNPSNVISSNNYFCGTWDAANNCSDVTLLTNNQVKSGEACYRLNNGRVNNEMVWYQTLGEDTYPVPDNRHLPISLVEDSYINDRIINFADANVKAICVANWDTNGDGELSEAEAAAVPDLGEVFKGNTTITSFNELQYFTRLTSISNLAFNNCSALKSVTIPNSVTSIGAKAFGYTGLTTVTIGESVESIGEDAFNWCLSLKEIYCNAMETPDVTTGTFRTVKVAEVMLVVPDEAVELYKAHDVWKQFWIETPTVIPSMEDGGNKTEDGSIYNLSGQSLGKIQKGIYIKGGKKIISR